MNSKYLLATAALGFALATGTTVMAQTTSETTVKTDTSMKDGVATKKTKVEHVRKHKTGHSRKILGVKVGHKTHVNKTVKETTTSSNGDKSTTVKTSNK